MTVRKPAHLPIIRQLYLRSMFFEDDWYKQLPFTLLLSPYGLAIRDDPQRPAIVDLERLIVDPVDLAGLDRAKPGVCHRVACREGQRPLHREQVSLADRPRRVFDLHVLPGVQ